MDTEDTSKKLNALKASRPGLSTKRDVHRETLDSSSEKARKAWETLKSFGPVFEDRDWEYVGSFACVLLKHKSSPAGTCARVMDVEDIPEEVINTAWREMGTFFKDKFGRKPGVKDAALEVGTQSHWGKEVE